MSGRGSATGIEVCFISELYTLLRLLKAPAEGVFILEDVDVKVKMWRAFLLRGFFFPKNGFWTIKKVILYQIVFAFI